MIRIETDCGAEVNVGVGKGFKLRMKGSGISELRFSLLHSLGKAETRTTLLGKSCGSRSCVCKVRSVLCSNCCRLREI
jgi:hypothetical protein